MTPTASLPSTVIEVIRAPGGHLNDVRIGIAEHGEMMRHRPAVPSADLASSPMDGEAMDELDGRRPALDRFVRPPARIERGA